MVSMWKTKELIFFLPTAMTPVDAQDDKNAEYSGHSHVTEP